MSDTETHRTELVPLMPDGVYFGLSDAIYHADSALGSGDIRALAKCPMYYWQSSAMNPFREDKPETDALLYGRALHKVVLEGRAAFERSFACPPDRKDHPDALDTVEDIKAHLKALGGKVSGAKNELIARIRELGSVVPIWQEIVDAEQARASRNGQALLKRDVYDGVIAAAGRIAGNPAIAGAFQDGRSEVSVFWTVDGVRLKARLDYLRLGNMSGKTIGLVTDLKSFAARADMAPERCVTNAIAEYRLDIQAAHYLEGAREASRMIGAGMIQGAADVSRDWLQAIASLGADEWAFYWAFYAKDAPVSMLRHILPGTTIIDIANGERRRAIDAYKEHMSAFGDAWRFVDPIPDTQITLDCMPKWYAAA